MTVLGIIRFSLLLERPSAVWELARAADQSEFISSLFSEERLAQRFRLFEAFCLPSLDAQTERNFEILVVASAEMPGRYKDRLNQLAETREYLRVHYSPAVPSVAVAIKNGLSEIGVAAGPLLSFRLDDDDALCRSFVEDLLTRCRESRGSDYVVTAPGGYYMRNVMRKLELGYVSYPGIGIGLARAVSDWGLLGTVYNLGNHKRIQQGSMIRIREGRVSWLRSIYGTSDSAIVRDAFEKHVKGDRWLFTPEAAIDFLRDEFQLAGPRELHNALC